jgi:hypothetical protein
MFIHMIYGANPYRSKVRRMYTQTKKRVAIDAAVDDEQRRDFVLNDLNGDCGD